jgi:uncharacterized protein YuzE
MKVDHDKLIQVLSNLFNEPLDTTPKESVYISFPSDHERVVKESLTFHSVNGSNIVIDLDDGGKILGIEIV